MWIFSHHLRHSGKTTLRSAERGFTLVELLVVASIIVVITTVLLLRQSQFNSSTILRSMAYSVALSVRQSQVYGTSVLGSSDSGAVTYASGYGLYFSNSTPTSYVLFADFNNNGAYNAATETVKVFSISSGYTIREVCAKLSNGINRCSAGDDTTGSKTTDSLTILFRRPNPDASFKTDVGGEQYTSGYIQIASADGTTRSVLVTSAGQISVQSPGTLP